MYAFANIDANLGFNGEFGGTLFEANFNRQGDLDFFNENGYEGPYMGASGGLGLSFEYNWSNELSVFELWPNTRSETTWTSKSIGTGTGEYGARVYTGKKIILNDGEPLWELR